VSLPSLSFFPFSIPTLTYFTDPISLPSWPATPLNLDRSPVSPYVTSFLSPALSPMTMTSAPPSPLLSPGSGFDNKQSWFSKMFNWSPAVRPSPAFLLPDFFRWTDADGLGCHLARSDGNAHLLHCARRDSIRMRQRPSQHGSDRRSRRRRRLGNASLPRRSNSRYVPFLLKSFHSGLSSDFCLALERPQTSPAKSSRNPSASVSSSPPNSTLAFPLQPSTTATLRAHPTRPDRRRSLTSR
jgi:hypothetical protein